MEISTQEILRLAERMRLNLTEEEVRAYALDLAALEQLAVALLPFSESDSEEALSTGLCEMRADEKGTASAHDVLFANASRQNGVFLTVPRVIGEGDA